MLRCFEGVSSDEGHVIVRTTITPKGQRDLGQAQQELQAGVGLYE